MFYAEVGIETSARFRSCNLDKRYSFNLGKQRGNNSKISNVTLLKTELVVS